MQRLRCTQVGGIGMHPSVARGFGDVAGVPTFGWPGLVIFLTVVAQSCLYPFREGRHAASVPFLLGVAGRRKSGAAALVC